MAFHKGPHPWVGELFILHNWGKKAVKYHESDLNRQIDKYINSKEEINLIAEKFQIIFIDIPPLRNGA